MLAVHTHPKLMYEICKVKTNLNFEATSLNFLAIFVAILKPFKVAKKSSIFLLLKQNRTIMRNAELQLLLVNL